MGMRSMGRVVFLVCAAGVVSQSAADVPYFNGFETSTSVNDFFGTSGAAGTNITRVASGSGVLDTHRPRGEREDAMAAVRRRKWLRGIVYPEKPGPLPMIIKSPKPQQEFVSAWPKVGIVTQMDGPKDPGFPDTLWVETGRSLEPLDQRAKQVELRPIINENPNDER